MKDYIEKQVELHKKIADEYDYRYAYPYALLFQDYWNNTILNLIPKTSGTVLELGCGTGIFLNKLAKRFNKIYGIDVSLDMLKKIRVQHKNYKGCIAGDGMNMPYSGKSFDVVFCRGVLHHLPSLPDSLTEINRVLKSDGMLIFSEPSNDSLIVRLARKKMYSKSDKFSEDDVAFLSRELVTTLKKTGYQISHIEWFGFLSYVFAGFPDHFSLLAKIPGNVILTKIFIAIDKILSRTPLLNRQSLHIIILATKI